MTLLGPDQPSKYGKSAITRFLSYIEISKDNTCWEWIGAKHSAGYCLILFNGKMTPAHHFIYEYMYGAVISTESQLDHTCKNRFCANPKHLEVITSKENTVAGI